MARILQAAIMAASLTFAFPAFSAEKAQGFVDAAAVGGLFEVESSELALKMAKADDVESFAQTMINDHKRANATLEGLATKEGFKVPKTLDKKHEAKIQTLKNAGAQFDPPYVKAQLEGHQDTVQLFETYASSGDNAALRAFAAETLPKLKEHLKTIEGVSRSLGTQ